MINFNNKQTLITGGTGSFGNEFINQIIKNKVKPKKIVIYSRDEFKQSEMQKRYPTKKYPYLRFFLGDVRDKERLSRALEKIDFVIHAAALKHVNLGEYNPMEVIKTNIIGAQNIVECCLDKDVNNIIALSTDKASSPINLYGASKLCSDKIFVSANNIKGNKKCKFSVVRYGNVLGSRGSVLSIFKKSLINNSVFPITDKNMTRFNITLSEGVNFVAKCFRVNTGGEIFVPKLKTFKVIDLAKAIKKNCQIKEIGIRPGEKLHEELISETDAFNTIENNSMFIIIDTANKDHSRITQKHKGFKSLKKINSYRSNLGKQLNSSELRKILIKENLI